MNLFFAHNTGNLMFADRSVEPVFHFPVCDALIMK